MFVLLRDAAYPVTTRLHDTYRVRLVVAAVGATLVVVARDQLLALGALADDGAGVAPAACTQNKKIKGRPRPHHEWPALVVKMVIKKPVQHRISLYSNLHTRTQRLTVREPNEVGERRTDQNFPRVGGAHLAGAHERDVDVHVALGLEVEAEARGGHRLGAENNCNGKRGNTTWSS